MRRRKSTYEYIGFNDTWFILLGTPLVALVASIVFCDVPFDQFIANFFEYYGPAFVYASAYWTFNRSMIVYMRRRMPSMDDALKRSLIQIGLALVISPIISALVHNGLGIVQDATGLRLVGESKSFTGLLTTYILIFLILAIYEAMYFFKQYSEAIVLQEKIRAEHANTQLIHLRNQVNPHFLFNSLNTLMSLIPEDAEKAHQYLNKLSRFYRKSVNGPGDLLIPLEEELENLSIYVELIAERFGNGLVVQNEIVPEDGEIILPMSLQLLVENAVKHNIVSKDEPLHIHLYKLDGYIHVENNIQRRITETSSTGIGLSNIKQRFGHVTEDPVGVDQRNGLYKVSLPLLAK